MMWYRKPKHIIEFRRKNWLRKHVKVICPFDFFINQCNHSQRVNATPHVWNSTLSFMDDNDINLLPWPAVNLHINLIKNLLGNISSLCIWWKSKIHLAWAFERKNLDTWNATSLEEVNDSYRLFSKMTSVCSCC